MKKSEEGFGTAKVILIVVIIGVIGFVGWWVWNAQKGADKTLESTVQGANQAQSQAKANNTDAPDEQKSTNVVKIPEMGIQFTAPDDIKNITYVIEKQTDNRGKEAIYARLTSKTLTDISPECDAAGSSIGVITKGLGTKPEENEEPRYYGELMKQFDSFFITYERSHAVCTGLQSDSAEYDKAVSEQNREMTALETAVKSVTEIE